MSLFLLNLRAIGGLVLVIPFALPNLGYCEEPSPRLKQADTDYRLGVAALSHNDLNTARQEFEKVVQLAPSAEQGHSALGAVLVRLGHTTEGIRELEKALAMKTDDSSAQLNLAIALEQSGQAAKALPWFAKLESGARAQGHSLSPEVLAAYARSLAATRQYVAAATKMKEALAGAPANAKLLDELGSIYAQHQDWMNAQQSFKTALQADPELAIAHLHLAVTLQTEQQPGALEEFAKAYQLDPQNAAIALEFGQFLAANGNDEQAVPVLRRAMELAPRSPTAPYQLGLALQRTNKLDEAIPLLQKAASLQPNNVEVLTNLGMALCQVQQAKDAVPLLQHAVAMGPNNVTAHQNLAAAYIQLSQFDDAITQLRTALTLSPDAARLHYDLGLALKMKDDAADAIPELETAEKQDPSAHEAPYVLGVLYMQAGRYADAERELKFSLKLYPDNGDGWSTLGSVDNHLDHLPEAEVALKQAIHLLPQQPDPHLTLAAVLVKENKPAEATAERKIAANLMRTNMNHQRAEVASNSGNSMLKDGKVDDAVSAFREALSYDSDYAEAHAGLAKALEQQGKATEAAVERQKAESLEKANQ